MIRCVSVLVAAGLMTAGVAGLHAAEAANAKLLGTWTHHRGDYRVKLEIKPDRLHCTIASADGIAFAVEADYVISKDGVLLGIVRAKGTAKQDDGDALQDRLFYCRVTAKERTLKISGLDYGGDDGDGVTAVLEGTYARHDSKHAGAARMSRPEHAEMPRAVGRNDKQGAGSPPTQAPTSTRLPSTANGWTDLPVPEEWLQIWQFLTPPQPAPNQPCHPPITF